METTVNQRIVNLLSVKKITKTEFCKETSIPYQTIINIIGDRQTKPSFEILEKILTTYENINSDWLIKGKGEMFLSEVKTQTNKHPESRTSQWTEEWYATVEKLQEEVKLYKQEMEYFKTQNMKLTDMLGKLSVSSIALLVSKKLGLRRA
jgi:maltooligosyltrehalose synthase